MMTGPNRDQATLSPFLLGGLRILMSWLYNLGGKKKKKKKENRLKGGGFS